MAVPVSKVYTKTRPTMATPSVSSEPRASRRASAAVRARGWRAQTAALPATSTATAARAQRRTPGGYGR